ncbi:MAG TPA: NAD-dependent epimerase/dehydratase [Verrucomicrobiae bacterium]|nr:NAD-dependent epimerase/dehydratase [Verrucomicrobiae bacterium]
MSERILVTGGAGYLGSIMVPELLNAGYQVTVLDNFMYHQNSLNHVCANPKFEAVRGDTRDAKVMKALLAKADVIIPLAALVGAPLCDRDPIAATTTNRDAVVSIVKALSKEQKILMPVTNSGYGVGEKNKECTEDSPLNPISLYGRDKVEAEQAILSRPNSISFRLATVFGMSPRMRIDLLVNDFTYRAVYDRFIVLFEAHFKRNYVHVRDVARVFLHGLKNFDKLKGQAYNVGLSDANLSKLELAQRIKKFIPSFTIMEAPVGEDPDKRDYIVSNAKIEKTGFKPQHSLDDGIRELIKGYTMIKNTIYTNI